MLLRLAVRTLWIRLSASVRNRLAPCLLLLLMMMMIIIIMIIIMRRHWPPGAIRASLRCVRLTRAVTRAKGIRTRYARVQCRARQRALPRRRRGCT